MLRNAFPDCSLTTDLIVGFPGESTQDFEQTLSFIQSCMLSDIHVFPYSIRPGTPAAQLSEQIPDAEKTLRAQQAKVVAAQMNLSYRQQFIGRTLEVLFEHTTKSPTRWSGHSAYCFSVEADHPDIHKNQLMSVLITDVTESGLFGKVCL